MKSPLLRLTAALCLAAVFTLTAAAQASHLHNEGCGYTGRDPWLDDYQNGKIAPVGKSNDTTYLPLRVISVGTDEGEGYPRLSIILDAIRTVNEDFGTQNIQFYLTELLFEPNSALYQHEIDDATPIMRRLNKPGVINNYLVEDPEGLCGYFRRDVDVVVNAINCIDPGERTWSHELGHFFSLPHTFVGWEGLDIADQDFSEPAPRLVNFGRFVEKADSSNCASAADGFCDTPADYLSDRWRCDDSGMYGDTLTDPDGRKFRVPGANIMSYSLDECQTLFSGEQRQAMATNVDSRTSLMKDFTPDATRPDVASLTNIAPANNESIEFSNFVRLEWSAVEGVEFYIVELATSSSFDNSSMVGTYVTTETELDVNEEFRPRARYFWRVYPIDNYYFLEGPGQTTRFRAGQNVLSSTIDAAFNAAVSVVPNPAGGGQTIAVTGRDLGTGGRLHLQLLDAAGRVLVDRAGIPVTSTGFRESVPTAGLSSGVYFLRLRLNDRLVTRRVMVRP